MADELDSQDACREFHTRENDCDGAGGSEKYHDAQRLPDD